MRVYLTAEKRTVDVNDSYGTRLLEQGKAKLVMAEPHELRETKKEEPKGK